MNSCREEWTVDIKWSPISLFVGEKNKKVEKRLKGNDSKGNANAPKGAEPSWLANGHLQALCCSWDCLPPAQDYLPPSPAQGAPTNRLHTAQLLRAQPIPSPAAASLRGLTVCILPAPCSAARYPHIYHSGNRNISLGIAILEFSLITSAQKLR